MWRRILRKSVKKDPFLIFFQKNANVSIFCWDSKLIIWKNGSLPQFFFVDSNSPCKDLLFLRGPKLAQKPLYLVKPFATLESRRIRSLGQITPRTGLWDCYFEQKKKTRSRFIFPSNDLTSLKTAICCIIMHLNANGQAIHRTRFGQSLYACSQSIYEHVVRSPVDLYMLCQAANKMDGETKQCFSIAECQAAICKVDRIN